MTEQVTLQAPERRLVGRHGEGLYRFPAHRDSRQLDTARPLAVYTTKDGLAAPQVFRLFEDSRGNVWISTIHPITERPRPLGTRAARRCATWRTQAGFPRSRTTCRVRLAKTRPATSGLVSTMGWPGTRRARFTFFTRARDCRQARS